MHQIEIDLIEPKLLQGSIECPADCIGRQVFVPDLCGDVQILAGDLRCGKRRADGFLIAYISAVSRCR
jgi:hypothetical protein